MYAVNVPMLGVRTDLRFHRLVDAIEHGVEVCGMAHFYVLIGNVDDSIAFMHESPTNGQPWVVGEFSAYGVPLDINYRCTIPQSDLVALDSETANHYLETRAIYARTTQQSTGRKRTRSAQRAFLALGQ